MKVGKSKSEAENRGSRSAVNKRGKLVKDLNKPKRPARAFFVFMEDFRKTFKEKHPYNKSVAVVGKAGGDKWKSISEADKAPYEAKAEKRKLRRYLLTPTKKEEDDDDE